MYTVCAIELSREISAQITSKIIGSSADLVKSFQMNLTPGSPKQFFQIMTLNPHVFAIPNNEPWSEILETIRFQSKRHCLQSKIFCPEK
jgi:hypothetical protein